MLVEGDDFNEPIPDAVKGITDGQLWLSRSLANSGHFPAIDVLQSISRVRGDVADKAHRRAARRVLALLATYQEIEDLVNIGAYVPGVNLEFDLAVQARPRIIEFLRQESQAPVSMEETTKQLTDLVAWIDQAERGALKGAAGDRCQARRAPNSSATPGPDAAKARMVCACPRRIRAFAVLRTRRGAFVMARLVFALELVLRQRAHVERGSGCASWRRSQGEMTRLQADQEGVERRDAHGERGPDMKANHLTGPIDVAFLAAHRRATPSRCTARGSRSCRTWPASSARSTRRNACSPRCGRSSKVIEKLREKHLGAVEGGGGAPRSRRRRTKSWLEFGYRQVAGVRGPGSI